jgi:hypothetical protein
VWGGGGLIVLKRERQKKKKRNCKGEKSKLNYGTIEIVTP